MAKDELDSLDYYFDTAVYRRGFVIGLSAQIENMLTDIIAWCFYPSRYYQQTLIEDLLDSNGLTLKTLVLNKINFRDKIEMFRDILLVKNSRIIKTDDKLIKLIVNELDEVRKFRNLLAHSELSYPKDFIDPEESPDEKKGTIYFTDFKKGKVVRHIINEGKYIMETNTMSRVISRLWQLFSLMNDDLNSALAWEEDANKYQ